MASTSRGWKNLSDWPRMPYADTMMPNRPQSTHGTGSRTVMPAAVATVHTASSPEFETPDLDSSDTTSAWLVLQPAVMVIFGATGDLTARKLMPARGSRPGRLSAAGVGDCGRRRRDKTDDQFCACSKRPWRSSLPKPGAQADVVARFLAANCLPQRQLQPARRSAKPRGTSSRWSASGGLPGNRLFYLATDPDFFAPIVDSLSQAGLVAEANGGGWRRVVIEKPFGHDLTSAGALECRHPQAAARAPDLPHRPLPGQGDRAEPAGLPFRQRDLRTAVEPAVCRPRADHRRRDRGHGGPPRRLSTTTPARSAT